MDRRQALKGLGLTLGYVAATPTIFSILQSCKTETNNWKPIFLTKDEGVVIKNLVDLILPKTDGTPGALDVNVPEFIDLYASKVYNETKKDKFKKGISEIMKALDIPNKKISSLKANDYDVVLTKYLKAGKAEKEAINNNKEDIIVLEALNGLRNSSIWAYKTSQEIGENVLAYDPIPGVQKGCISVQEATGGKAWSL
jgi:tetratricopeptide (TPR) repeat protein